MSDQTLHLQIKEEKFGRTPKCVACKREVKTGTLCFTVEAMWVPLVDDRAQQRKFYICPTRSCVFKPSPPWANIRSPTNFTTAADVPEADRERVAAECNLNVV